MKIYENFDINDLENEIWKDILDYEGDYQVSNIGRVKSLKFGKEKIKKILIDHKGYFYSKLWINGKSKNKKIHILLFETFNNYKLKPNECVHHIDLNPKNNNIDNLKLMNIHDHKIFHHTNINYSFFGKKHSKNSKIKMSKNSRTHKLEDWQVKAIYQISNSPIIKQLKITQKEIGEVFRVDARTISSIKTGKIWSHVTLENL